MNFHLKIDMLDGLVKKYNGVTGKLEIESTYKNGKK